MFACLYAPPRGLAFRSADGAPRPVRVTDQLVRLAREYSPRIEVHGDNLVVLDTTGLKTMFGDARELGTSLRRAAADRGLYLRIAIASTRTAALLVVQERSGLTVIAPGCEADTLAPLSLDVLKALAQEQAQEPSKRTRRGTSAAKTIPAISAFALLSTVRRWGISTLGDLTRLPSPDLFERLGAGGLTLQRFARGEDAGPLVPAQDEERFESTLALEWPVEGLEPLSFVLGRVLEPLGARLERAGVGAAVLHLHLKLVTKELHSRTLQLATSIRDPKVLRTLILLDLESHAPSAGVDQVTVLVEPVPARTQQFSLLEQVRPAPEQVSVLLARLTALVGDGRCGAPALVDAHDAPGQPGFEMREFTPDRPRASSRPIRRARTPSATSANRERRAGAASRGDRVRETAVDGDWRPRLPCPGAGPAAGTPRPPRPMLRRYRAPVAARVTVRHGRPTRVIAPRVSGGEVVQAAGPWRASGQWWCDAAPQPDVSDPEASTPGAWDRDEWDVSLTDGGVYRIFHDRHADRWYLDAMVD